MLGRAEGVVSAGVHVCEGVVTVLPTLLPHLGSEGASLLSVAPRPLVPSLGAALGPAPGPGGVLGCIGLTPWPPVEPALPEKMAM